MRRQCDLIEVSRASFYYQAQEESDENLLLMRLLDEQYLRTPFYGVLKMTECLRKIGYPVKCQTRETTVEADRDLRDLPATTIIITGVGPSDLSVLIARPKDRASESSVEH